MRTGQSEMAIVGGVNLNLSPTPFIGLSRVTALSKKGVCYPFDSRADGMVLSEGASAVLLKPLENAMRDGDNILAVIKGSAMNNDGHSQGLTAPRPQGQADAIRKAYLEANINPETVSYIETHGTGTPLGDPIEIEGMNHAFRSFTSEKGFCAIGSVKSSIGHMLSASGVTSLIKVVLALKNKKIPHTVNYDKSRSNPNIDFANSPFYVVSGEPMEWKGNNITPLRARVNAFGFGGTNVHVVLEKAPDMREYEEERPPYLLQLTGRNENVVKRIAANLKNHIEQHENLSAASICFTVNSAQKELITKTAAVVKSRAHLLEVLASLENGSSIEGVYKGRSHPNRENQAYLMLDDNIKISEDCKHDLCSRFAAFDTAYRECMDRYKELKNGYSEEIELIDSFAVQYALGILLNDFNLNICGIIAQGTGILTAAVLTGLINLEQALGQLIHISIIEDGNYSKSNENAVYLNSPILTPSGVIEEFLDIPIKVIENIKRLDGFVNKNQVVIYPSKVDKIKNKEFYDDRLLNWVEMNINENAVESIITAFAKLYVLGTRYNPNKLSTGKEKKVALPTYPFENETYRISFQEKAVDVELNSATTQQKGLVKIDRYYTLSDMERKSSCNGLDNDLKKLII